jgi:integrase
MMHTALAAISTGHMTFRATQTGRTRSSVALGHLIRESAAAAGFDKSAHGLRATRAIDLAENGATTHQVGAWTGHKSLKEIEHYTTDASRRRAVMGMHDVPQVDSDTCTS